MEFHQTVGLNPYLYSTYGQQGIHKAYENNSAISNDSSFRDTLQDALRTTESMESIFQEASQKYHVALNLLKAIGKAESGFNPQAVSSAGAQGVMQLMPATARSLGVEDSFDARSNIMGGAKYIASLLERYQGDTVLALSAYNAGSGNVDKYGGVPPFKETQNYVQKVLSYAGENIDLNGVLTGGASGGVYRSAIDTLSSLAAGVDSSRLAFDQEDAQYLMELMRLRMENMFRTEVLSGDEDENSNRDTAVGSLL